MPLQTALTSSPSLPNSPLNYSSSLDTKFASKPEFTSNTELLLMYLVTKEVALQEVTCCGMTLRWAFQRPKVKKAGYYCLPFYICQLWKEKTVAKDFSARPIPADPMCDFLCRLGVSATTVFNSAMFMKAATWNLKFWHQKWFEF